MTTAIQCEGLSKSYPRFKLDELHLRLEQGSIMGLVGPNGAGKSTLLRLIMGFIASDRGAMKVLQHKLPAEQKAAKREIGFVSEDCGLYANETIAFHMEFISSIFPTWDEAYAASLLTQLDLEKQQKVKGLSRGQRVKTALLLALARRPKILILDEPTAGLDPVARKIVLNEMMAAIEDETHSILFSSHNTVDVEQISDYITFINQGRVVESLDKESFLENWRRLRLVTSNIESLQSLPNVKELHSSGSLVTVTVNNYSEQLCKQLEAQEFRIEAVERMTLEEIFICNIENQRGLTDA